MQTLRGNFKKVNSSFKELTQIFSKIKAANQKYSALEKEEFTRLYVLHDTQKGDIKGIKQDLLGLKNAQTSLVEKFKQMILAATTAVN